MARTLTATDRANVAALLAGHYSKLEIQDADGVYRDYTQYLRTDWFTGATIEESQDQSTMTLNATLLRQSGTLSLSPFRSDSLVNRNGAGAYATAIDAWRKWRLSVAVRKPGYPPTGTDWKELCQGRIDVIEWSGDLITVTGRGEEAVLLDFWIASERQYGSGGGTAMETTIQSQVDDNLSAGIYSLYTPVSPSYLMLPWTQPKDRLFPSLTAVSDKAGFNLRFRYDAADSFRLTLFQVNRNAVPGNEVWTIGASEITGYRRVAIDKTGIRNFIKLRFAHPTLGTQTVISPWQAGTGTVSCAAGVATFSTSQAAFIKTTGSKTEIIVAGIAYTVNTFNGTTGATLISQLATGGVPTFGASSFTLSDTKSGSGNGSTTSIDRFGRNDLEIDQSYASQITDPTKAQGMADAVRSDTEFPPAEQEIETLGFWFAQLGDYGRFLANGVHYDTDLYGGVTKIRHEIANGTIKTTLSIRGKPSSKYAGWRFIQGAQSGASSAGSALTFAECLTTITATSATQVTVTVTANPASPPQQVQLVGITGGASLASGTAAGTWVTPNGSNNVWVFNRAAINGGVGQVQFRAGNTSAFPNDDKFVAIEEQGRDTVYLAMRARVTAQTATTLTVRVAVADPYPQGANSVSIATQDNGVGSATTPSSPQTVTPAATITEAAGTFVDYAVTRPAFGSGAGRVTFTASATGRTTDSDAVDVPEVGRDTVSLLVRARIISQTAFAAVVRVAVADPYPQGANSATINYLEFGTGAPTSPASGQTVTPAATITEAAGTFVDFTITRQTTSKDSARVTFTATAAGRTDHTASVDVQISFNGQGSFLPTPVDKSLFTYNSGGATSGQMWLSWTWPAFTIPLPDGSSISVPASSSLTSPPTPTLSQVAGGALSARTRFVVIGYTKNQMIYRTGAEASLAVSANNLLKVTSPASVAGYDGWVPLVGSSTLGEFTQSSVGAGGIAFGTDWTEPTTGADISGQTPYSNAKWPLAVTAIGLNASSTFFYYLWWEIATSLVAFADRGQLVQVAASAIKQFLDGRIALVASGVQGLTPAGGTTGNGNPAAGRNL